MSVLYRRSTPEDGPQMCAFWEQHWGADLVIVHGDVFRPEDVQGFIALEGGQWVGLVTYAVEGASCEVVTLDSLHEGCGIGTRLLEQVAEEARRAGCQRICLTTTNDNLHALGFYQKRGFRLCALRPAAIEASRKVKPAIPLIGMHGIPLRDEIELEMKLPQGSARP